jgi:hypothetical protein
LSKRLRFDKTSSTAAEVKQAAQGMRERARDTGAAFSLVTFLLAEQEKVTGVRTLAGRRILYF